MIMIIKKSKTPDKNRRHFLKNTFLAGRLGTMAHVAQKFSLITGIFLFRKKAFAQMIPFAMWKKQQTPLTLWSWGVNIDGELGIGNTIDKSSPVQIGALSNWSTFSAGSLHVAAIKQDGSLWTWGDNVNGELGIGSVAGKSSPVQVGALTDWAKISCGGMYTAAEHYYMMATKTDGTLWAWGDNSNGQLGDGTTVSKSSPIQIGALTDWATVTTGWGMHTFAVKTDGTLWAWGNGAGGRLGDGTTVSKSSPIQIGALTNWSKVYAGVSHAIAIKADGTLWAWGNNSSGQLGNGSTVAKSSPIQIGALTTWAMASAGGDQSLATKTDGTLWAWGNNIEGELGIGTTVDKNSPVQVGALTDWASVSVGVDHVAAIKTDGTIWTWGFNTNGNLGDGTTVAKSSPIQVGALTTWTKVQATESFTVAMK